MLSNYVINFFLPLGCVFYGLDISNIGDHNDPRCVATKVFIDSKVAGVHANQIPNLQPNIVSLDVHLFDHVFGAHGSPAWLEPISTEAVTN